MLCTRRTSRVLEWFFIVSLVSIVVDVTVNPLVSSLAIMGRFVVVSAMLVAFSQETFWKTAKKNSAVCGFLRRLLRSDNR
ncbi:MAG TPA: hypothetical protein PLJ26_04110 [Candidatus Omnitrophota bacterium]|nr:hypothetical protein [Candidatus Omnitrophota bacterium]